MHLLNFDFSLCCFSYFITAVPLLFPGKVWSDIWINPYISQYQDRNLLYWLYYVQYMVTLNFADERVFGPKWILWVGSICHKMKMGSKYLLLLLCQSFLPITYGINYEWSLWNHKWSSYSNMNQLNEFYLSHLHWPNRQLNMNQRKRTSQSFVVILNTQMECIIQILNWR